MRPKAVSSLKPKVVPVRNSLLLLASFIVLSLIVSCASNTNENKATDTEMSVSALRQSPDTLFADTIKYCAEIYSWRDFMPGMDVNNPRGLMVVAKVRSCNTTPLDEDVRLSYLWVVHGEEVWATTLESQQNSGENHSGVESTARSGPCGNRAILSGPSSESKMAPAQSSICAHRSSQSNEPSNFVASGLPGPRFNHMLVRHYFSS